MTDLINPSEIEPIDLSSIEKQISSLNKRLEKLEFKISANDQISRVEYLEQVVTSMIANFPSEAINK